jgi:predicted ATPase/serine/threonine protein kinase
VPGVERFGRYTLLKRLGAGGMGEVFLARADDGAELVVKRILPHLVENPRFLRLFLDETRIAARLVHPNIARIVELGEADGTWFVAMEHVPGKDLRELLKRAREQGAAVPVEVGLRVAVEVARGLHAAHEATDAQDRALRIVHRDVSPHNVLVARSGAVKLIDFGVAKAANKAVHTATGILKGKFPYMSPEQAHARPVDARTDVFALGIVLWEMLAGRYLFRGKTDALTLKLVRAAEVPSLSELRPDVTQDIERAVNKALRKDPKDRYPTAAAFAETLERLLSEFPPADLAGWMYEYDDLPGFDDGEADSEAGPASAAPDFNEAKTQLETGASEGAGVGPDPRARRAATDPDSDSGASQQSVKELLAELSGRPTNIGAQATTFVGRVAELADLHQLFRQGAQLLTLLGPGGTGKTRLSLQFGSQLVTHFQGTGERGRKRGGVWFCDLSEATDVDDICVAVSRALAVPLAPGDAVTQLGHAIAARGEVLLVLDNFEQIVACAPATVEKWMRAAPEARFMVSSRELLRVAKETIFEVPPLRTPREKEAVRSSEAVELFIERARAVRTGWEPTPAEDQAIAEIVRQLDGLPLAIELAAARMTVLSPVQLVQRLPRRFDLLVGRRDAQERQATLRGAIDWSWNMLSVAEASALAQLSVFRGGFGAEAAEAVVSLGHVPDAPTPLEALMLLRSKSLVRAYFPLGEEGETRFGLFESIREYSREKLAALPEGPGVMERHAAYYLKLAARVSVGVEGRPSQLDALDLERENLNAVFQRAVETRERTATPLRVVLALDALLSLRGPFPVHLAMLDAALERLGADLPHRALGLEARGRARQARGRLADAEADYLEALTLAQSLRDPGLEGRLESYLGVVERLKGARADARRHFARALQLLEPVGDHRTVGRTLSNLAVLLHEMGLGGEAMEAYNRALEIHREVGDRRYEGVTLANLGVQQQSVGLLKQARANYQSALAIHRELGNRRSEGISHINLGDLSRDLGQPGQSRTHYESALEILREVGGRRFEGVALVMMASLHQELGEYAQAIERYHAGIETLAAVGDQRYEGLARAGLAAVEGLQGRTVEAEEGMAEASRLLATVGDASFLDALDLYRGHLELAHARSTRSERQAETLEQRVARRLEHAERVSAPDEHHPAGMPSPADRSEHVRIALRSLRTALELFRR